MPLTLPWTKKPAQEAKGTTSGVATPWSTPPVDEAAGASSDAPAGITTPWSKSPMGDLGASAGTMWSDLAAGKGIIADTSLLQNINESPSQGNNWDMSNPAYADEVANRPERQALPEGGQSLFDEILKKKMTDALAGGADPGKAYRDDIVVEDNYGVGAGFGDVGADVGDAPGSDGDTLYDQADSFWGDISGQFPEQLADTERIAGRKEALAARRASEMGSSMGSGLSGGLAGGLAQAQLTGQQAMYDEQRQVKQRQMELQVTRLDQMIQEARDAKEFERAQMLQLQRDTMMKDLAYAGALGEGPSGA